MIELVKIVFRVWALLMVYLAEDIFFSQECSLLHQLTAGKIDGALLHGVDPLEALAAAVCHAYTAAK